METKHFIGVDLAHPSHPNEFSCFTVMHKENNTVIIDESFASQNSDKFKKKVEEIEKLYNIKSDGQNF